MKKWTALLLICALLLSLAPAALAESAKLYFGRKQVSYNPDEGVVLTVKSTQPAQRDIEVLVEDQDGAVYSATLPRGKDEISMLIAENLPANGAKSRYILAYSADYVRRSPGACVAVPRGETSYTFANPIYQTFAGRELRFTLQVENPGALAAGTPIVLRDENGAEWYRFAHEARKTAYTFRFDTDDSWVPGPHLSVWVEGRETPDDTAVMAVGRTGIKAIWGVDRDDNKIAFTMDCGSHNRYVPRILDILDEYNVKITIFVTGKFAAANPDLVRDMVARGHEIGNHSWNHPNFDEIKKDEIYSELTRTNELLESITGKPITVFRPPYGHLGGAARSIVNALGMQAIRWTHESKDARDDGSVENSLRLTTRNLQGGSIILTHASSAFTLAVLDQILQFYQDNGFEVVPVSQLLLTGETYLDENGIQHARK